MKDPVQEMKNLLDELIITKAYLDKIEKRLKKINKLEHIDEWEDLYSKEFELCVKLSGIYYDIQKIGKRFKTSATEFSIRRIQKEADKVFKPLVVEIK